MSGGKNIILDGFHGARSMEFAVLTDRDSHELLFTKHLCCLLVFHNLNTTSGHCGKLRGGGGRFLGNVWAGGQQSMI